MAGWQEEAQLSLFEKFATKQIHSILASRGRETTWRMARNGDMIPLLTVLIEYCTLADGKGAIIQIGANDGVMEDPVRKSIVGLGLPALLVEPLPYMFEQLQKNYATQPGIRFENVAVGDKNGEATIYRIDPTATHFPEWVHMLASFDKTVITKHGDYDGRIQAVPVPVVTVGELLRRHPDLGPITALQIDTEGHDFVVVKSAVEAGCLPKIIHYEHRHLSFDDQIACRDLLAKHGYTFCFIDWDTLAFRSNA